jgi:tetratricopeptide (TPR) repeat protein
MWNRCFVTLLLLATSLASARDKDATWLQVTSPHFVVATNGSEKQARRVADQFERMRSLFHTLFPHIQTNLDDAPIFVLAVKDDKTFRALEPEAYLANGSLRLAGLFLDSLDRKFVLMRLDAEGDHPYSVIYHEYTHLLIGKSAAWMPLWLNEGLAEFYQNTDIREKEAELGQPSREDLIWLQQNRLIPLPTLFAVDQNSPYYHQENKGSIFYAESWALTHYIEVGDYEHKTHRMTDYLTLTEKNMDPVTAATQAFGDLKHLQNELENYIRETTYHYFRMQTAVEVDDSAFKVQSLTASQSDSLRAEFLAYNQRTADAQSLLDHVLQEDPNNVQAHETKGYLEFRDGHLEEARKWYAQAVQLDSQNFLAHYYFAAITMMQSANDSDRQQAENSLRTAIKLNASFAPSYDRLAVCLAQKRNLEEARVMELTAVSLDPTNIGFRVNMANIYMSNRQGQRAVEVLQAAAKMAKTPSDSNAVQFALANAQRFAEAQKEFAQRVQEQGDDQEDDQGDEVTTNVTAESKPAAQPMKQAPFVAKGPHRSVVGVLKGVRCESTALDLTVDTKDKQLSLHGDDYFKIPFTVLGFQLHGDLNPCKDLENRPAKVEYVESADPSVTAQVVAVELHK